MVIVQVVIDYVEQEYCYLVCELDLLVMELFQEVCGLWLCCVGVVFLVCVLVWIRFRRFCVVMDRLCFLGVMISSGCISLGVFIGMVIRLGRWNWNSVSFGIMFMFNLFLIRVVRVVRCLIFSLVWIIVFGCSMVFRCWCMLVECVRWIILYLVSWVILMWCLLVSVWFLWQIRQNGLVYRGCVVNFSRLGLGVVRVILVLFWCSRFRYWFDMVLNNFIVMFG